MPNFKLAFTLDDEFRKRLRPHTKTERFNLERLIEEEGCAEGSLTVGLIGDDKILVDGYTTLEICQEKGIVPAAARYLPFKDREAVLEWIDLRQRARRNLTAEEMAAKRAERIERVVEARADGQSIRTIAENEGVAIGTIQKDLQDSGVQGHTPEPPNGQVTGKDGKTYEAEKPKPILCNRCARNVRTGQYPVKGCEMCKELRPKAAKKSGGKTTSTSDKPAPVDALGTELPKKCRDAYCDPWIQNAIDLIVETESMFRKARLIDGMEKRKKIYPFFNPKDFIDGCGFVMSYLDQLLSHLKDNRPAGVCPMCEGQGCADCRMKGIVPRSVHAELKKKAKAKK